MTVIVIDGKNDEAMTIDTAAPDHRSLMLASAANLVATTLDMEGKLADTAKAWGASVFTLAYPADDAKPVTLDTLIGDSKMAAGWATITQTEAGKKAKSRMEVYFSNARLVAESFDSLSDDDKRDIRNGLSSVHYRAGLIRKAAADAKKAATKEAARIAAEAEAAASKAEADAPGTDVATPAPVDPNAERDASQLAAMQHAVYTVASGYCPVNMVRYAATDASVTMSDLLSLVSSKLVGASDDDLNGAYEAFADLVAAFDARINAATAEPVAIAA